MSTLLSMIAGLIFGLGLIVSGMGNPAKVLGFLDIAGNWDPSLVFVMGGAIVLGFAAFRAGGQRNLTLLDKPMQLPKIGKIDFRLLAGSSLFGIGWGLAGICPGPALVLIGIQADKGSVFVLAMLAGMVLFELQQRATK